MMNSKVKGALAALAFGFAAIGSAQAQSIAAPDGRDITASSITVGGLVFSDLPRLMDAGTVLRLDEAMRFSVRVANPDGILVRVWILPYFETRDQACDIRYQGADPLRLTGQYRREVYLLAGCDEVVLDGMEIIVLHERSGQEWEQRVLFR